MELKILRLGINGEGVAKIPEGNNQDKICFVEKALPDEVVNVNITNEKKSFCTASVVDIKSKSTNRIAPKCPYFGKCGGCDIQHMDKPLQEEFKTNLVKDAVCKTLKNNFQVQDVVRVNDFYYRNKMVFPITGDIGNITIGMFRANSHQVVDIDECILAKDEINKVLQLTKDYFNCSKYSGYDFLKKKGTLKYLVVRSKSEQILVTIVATKKIDLKQYYEMLERNFPKVGVSIIVSNNDNEILSGNYIYQYGIKGIDIVELGVKYCVDNRGFLQVNDDIKQYLYEKILGFVDSDDCVIDAYSGAGLLSSIVAKKCKKVIGIEINKSASQSARNLARGNALNNVDFINDDVEMVLEDSIRKYAPSVLILDPPRSGCSMDVLKVINNSIMQNQKTTQNKGINKLIYVSCNLATLMRDLKELTLSFDIKYLQPFDMFPQTKHIETLVCLQRRV